MLSHLGISPDSLHPWDDFNFVPITFTCEIAAHSLWPFRKGTVALLGPVTATKDISSKTPFKSPLGEEPVTLKCGTLNVRA